MDLEENGRGRTVMVAMDATAESFCALDWALDALLGRKPSEADKVVLVHARLPVTSNVAVGGPGYLLTAELILSTEKSRDRAIQALMNKAIGMCQAKKVKVETNVAWGDPKDVLCSLVQTIHVDVLVLGSKGHGVLKRMLLGSVSDYCARHASCPVVIVKNSRKQLNQIHRHADHFGGKN